MGWYATAQALKFGEGPYGTVSQSLVGESDPQRTVSVALEQIDLEIEAGEYSPTKSARARIAYWRKRMRVGKPTITINVTGVKELSDQLHHHQENAIGVANEHIRREGDRMLASIWRAGYLRMARMKPRKRP